MISSLHLPGLQVIKLSSDQLRNCPTVSVDVSGPSLQTGTIIFESSAYLKERSRHRARIRLFRFARGTTLIEIAVYNYFASYLWWWVNKCSAHTRHQISFVRSVFIQIVVISIEFLCYQLKGNGNIFFIFSFERTFKSIYIILFYSFFISCLLLQIFWSKGMKCPPSSIF
jgi:hypothetical protein